MAIILLGAGAASAKGLEHGRQRVQFYGCTSFWKRGATVCTNNMVARMDGLDAEVLATLEDDVMRPTVVDEAIRLPWRTWHRHDIRRPGGALE